MSPAEIPGTIVVPVDRSELSARAIPVGALLAQRLEAEVVLLSAVDDATDVELREKELADIEISAVPVRREVVVDRDPAGAIHEAVRRFSPAVGCMASHGRGRSAALVGSVATEVVARGRDPLVLVGPSVDERPIGSGKDVVACVDETPGSAAFLPVAVQWAIALGEQFKVLTVAEPAPPSPRDGIVYRAFGPDGDVEAFLDTLVAPLRDQGIPVETVPVYDPISPADGVRMHLRDHLAFLLVVSSHGRRGVLRFLLGSDAAAIVYGSYSPVLVVPREDPE